MNKQCKYQLAWIGQCRNRTENDFCDKHIKLKCLHCNKQSLGECEEDAGSFVCGFEVCEDKCHYHK